MTHGSLKSLTDEISRDDVIRHHLSETLLRARELTGYYKLQCDKLSIPSDKRPLLEPLLECEDAISRAMNKAEQAYAGYATIEDVRTDRE